MSWEFEALFDVDPHGWDWSDRWGLKDLLPFEEKKKPK